eukprot:jgi/Chrzof1/8888/Cz03g28020.t1
MQIFVRALDSKVLALHVSSDSSIGHVKDLLETRSGIPAGRQCLVYSGKQLDDSRMLPSYGIGEGSTLQMLLRLRGGVPIKVKILGGGQLACGPEVGIHVEADTPILEVKRQLLLTTGVPIEHQKVMLSGINQVVMADKRSSLKFSHCGTASSMYFAVMPKGQK